MKQTGFLRRLAVTLLLGGALVLTVVATQGSQSDPLVTLGYLSEQFLPKIAQQMEAKAVERDKNLESKVQAMLNTYSAEMEKKFSKALAGTASGGTQAPGFVTVNLAAGQTLTLSPGGELLLRTGTATCVAPSAPGLVDTTAGTALGGGGALVVHHLYLATDQGRGLKAVDGVVVLVRGEYTLAPAT